MKQSTNFLRTCKVRVASNCNLHLAVTGSKESKAILFLHGFSLNHQIWQKQLQSNLASQWYLLAPDFRGHGDSTCSYEALFLTPYLFAQDIQEMLHQMDIEKVVICAWSFSTRVIAEYLANFGTAKIAGLFMVSGSMGPDPVSDAWLKLISYFQKGDQPEKSLRELVKLLSDPQKPLKYKEKQAFIHMMDRVPDLVRQTLLSWPALEANEEIYRTLPTTIIHGVLDQLVPYEKAKSKYDHLPPQVKFKRFYQSGHLPFWEEPDLFNSCLGRFAKSII